MSFEESQGTFTPSPMADAQEHPVPVDVSNVVASNVLILPNAKTNSTPNEIESPIPCEIEVEGRKRKLSSEAWKHFKRTKYRVSGRLFVTIVARNSWVTQVKERHTRSLAQTEQLEI